MNRLLLAAVALSCVSVSAQTINPNQIKPSATDGQVITTSGGKTIWGAGGGGGGNINPAPQFRLFMQPNSGTQAVAGPAVTGTNAVAPMMQGTLNSDLYGSISNALASSDCTSGCDVEVPQTSTSTEEVTTKTNAQVHDFRLGSQGNFFQNPAAKTYNLFGDAYSGANTVYALWNQATPSTGNYPSQKQDVLHMVNTFNAPGFYYGTWGGPYLGSNWAQAHGISINQAVSTPSISQMFSGVQDSFKNADTAAAYLYNQTDGGCSSGGDECSTGIGVHNDQHSTWFHGTVGAGATTGTQLLPVTYVAGTNSRPQASVGGIMLNLHSIAVSGANVTGAATQVAGYAAWATPTDATVPVSGAWGLAQGPIPTPITNINPQSDTVTFTVAGGTNAGGFTTGVACLDGAAKYEQVAVTAVGTLSGGQQSVTFTHRYPNPQSGTSLWQNAAGGGLCGTYYMASEPFFNGPFAGWRTDYPVFGARSTHEIVGRFLTNTTGTLATALPIPTLWNSNTANVGLINLSVSGTTVTAGFTSTNQPGVFDNLASAVISNASNSAFNGTVTNVKLSNNNQTISWTQTGVSGTSATAQISYPAVYFNYYLFRGAAVTQPCTSAGCPLEPNAVDWNVGNLIENPFDPAFGGYMLTGEATANSPDSASINNIGAYGLSVSGAGISGLYTFFNAKNANASSMYIGAGGYLASPKGIVLAGPMSTALTVTQAPIDGKPYFSLGCVIAAQGGCGNARNDYQVVALDGAGKINYTSPTQEWFLNNIKTTRIRANILSTGDGSYVNGGVTGGAPVALTAASSSRTNIQAALGTYGVFGNESLLDTSAIMADKAHYAGTIYAGAASPTVTGVRPQGATGSSTWRYVATSVTQNGESLPSASQSTVTGNATLNSTNKNSIDILLGYGAQSTNIYRTAGPGGISLGLICSVPNNLISGTISTGACDDTGQTAGAAPPSVDTSGKLMDKSLADGCVNVASGVFGSTGTACGSGSGSMTWPAAAGIAVYAGSNAWGTSLTAPTGGLVGTTDTQTLTNKTLDGVSPATMAFVDPTSSVQTQLNAKAPLASPTFTGTATAANLTVTGTCTGCGSGISGSGTTGNYGLWTGTTAQGNGHLSDDGTNVTSSEPLIVPSVRTNSAATPSAVYYTANGVSPATVAGSSGWGVNAALTTPSVALMPDAPCSGLVTWTNVAGIMTSTCTTPPAALVPNIKDYGATGNGTTDDTTAIQSALNAVHTTGGGEVFCPAGKYKITAPLLIYSNTAFIGVGSGTGSGSTIGCAIVKTTNTVGTYGNVAMGSATDNYNVDAVLEIVHEPNLYAEHIQIKNVFLWGNSGTSNAYGIFNPRSDSSQFDNVTIWNQVVGFYTYNSWNDHLSSMTVQNTSHGFWWTDDGTGNATGDNNTLENLYVDGIVADAGRSGTLNAYSFYQMNYSSLHNLAADSFNVAAADKHGTNTVYYFFGCEGVTLSGSGAETITGGVYYISFSNMTINGVNTFQTNQITTATGPVAILTVTNSQVTLSGSSFAAISGTGNYYNYLVQNGSTLNVSSTVMPTGGDTAVNTVGTYSINNFNGLRPSVTGPSGSAIGTAIASASTIAPITGIVHITGTTAIDTITAPTGCTTTGIGCHLTLIPDGAFTWTTAGNIAATGTATLNIPVEAYYDPAATKWYLR